MLFLMPRRKLSWRMASGSPVKENYRGPADRICDEGRHRLEELRARRECSLVNRLENGMVPRWSRRWEWETPCQMTHTKEPPSSTYSRHMRTVRPPRTTGKKIIRPGMNI